MKSCGIHLKADLQEMFEISLLDLSLEIMNLRSKPHLPWANELTHLSTAAILKYDFQTYFLLMMLWLFHMKSSSGKWHMMARMTGNLWFGDNFVPSTWLVYGVHIGLLLEATSQYVHHTPVKPATIIWILTCDAEKCCRTSPTLVRVMACCLTVSSSYLIRLLIF